MRSDWAAENLQVIRTLMERSAVYRRALAPATLVIGVLGSVAALAGWFGEIDSPEGFAVYWMGVSLLALASAYVMMRRQALHDHEPFWSPPARRVTQAMLPALFVGLVAGLVGLCGGDRQGLLIWWLPPVWVTIYGCGVHAAGFFMPRGMKLFGWLFVICASLIFIYLSMGNDLPAPRHAHLVMGLFFGWFHLAYGLYLFYTEKRRSPA